jgi:hypothetical protein
MGKQHDPMVADPVVKTDFAFRRFSFEIRGDIANRKSHGRPPSSEMIARDPNKSWRAFSRSR